MNFKKVYLAGGFKSGWQSLVKDSCTQFHYFDPSLHNIADPAEYTNYDLEGVRECDIVFAFMEGSNPAGYALALEVGYAKGLGKLTIFVEEMLEHPKKRYFDMVRHACDYHLESLQDGIKCLETLSPDFN